MMDNNPVHIAQRLAKRRFSVFIISSIVVSLLLVGASLSLYNSSGTAQLDLSRPGYEKLRAQIQNDDTFEGFSSSGDLDTDALSAFDKLYDSKLKEAEDVDAFGNDVLSPKSLQIDQKAAQEDAQQ